MTAASELPHSALRARHRRPRVLQIVNSREPGGVLTLATLVEEGLRARGFAVETRVFSDDPAAGGAAKLQGLAAIAGDMLRGRYEAVMAYQAFACCLAGSVGRLAGIRHRVAHQTAMPDEVRPRWRRLDRLVGSLGGYTTNVANTAATEAAFAGYPATYRARMSRLPHGLVPLEASRGREATRRAFGLPAGVPLALAPGRQTDQKNQRVLLRALPDAPGLHLAVAGDGPLRAPLAAEARRLGVADRYHPLGDVPRSEMGNLLQAADAVLFPSVWETFGLAAVEAAMLGRPIVAADLPVLREVLCAEGQGPDAFLPPRDVAGWAAAMRRIASGEIGGERPAHREAMRRAHGLQAMIDRYEALLAS